ncbi:hypothetical protein [Methanonatronarchaeum sp. AMET6-2]|uniref:hypothetical protein n=1 Tax=Methanonatronarchaeum sp. AMET6-2 TaxID=2933293 RepID=UPI0012034510|nr:hypothetical protein [Methanonatronarchaeum sp. AMET6-2]RZN63459.1 MAG: glutamine amidotransferase [Methanonatronarchaeia archaeon]UOY09761.1 hypothetical protein MU439_05745 [Methanonatronarchaeum sp. AMET6-2]
MCGIAGIYSENNIDVGGVLTGMLDTLQHRGEDSCGIAVYGALDLEENENYILIEARENVIGKVESILGHKLKKKFYDSSEKPIYSGRLDDDLNVLRKKINRINAVKGANVISMGSLYILKDTGSVQELNKAMKGLETNGTHGIGHVRFSTESVVDRYHAHPFQSYIKKDISVVHNGQITNYLNLKTALMNKGHRFETNNDTECIVHYISDKLNNGYTLDRALEMSIQDMDGPFSYIISTDKAMGIAKDPLGLRPGVVGQKNGVYAVASEEVAIHRALGDVDIEYLKPGEHRTFGAE